MPLCEKPPASFTVSCRAFSTVPWRQQSLDHRPFIRCAGTVGTVGRGGAVGTVGSGRAAGLGFPFPGPDVSSSAVSTQGLFPAGIRLVPHTVLTFLFLEQLRKHFGIKTST